MPPKFQSSFIPSSPTTSPQAREVRHVDLLSLVTKFILGASVVLALGVIGYRIYLNYAISAMGSELESVRQNLSPNVVGELLDLNNRIISTQTLLEKHRVLSPLFTFLEQSTPQSVRLTEFSFTIGEHGPEVLIKGQAKSYSALALESQNVRNNKSFKDPSFSDIRLDDHGNVSFSLHSLVAPEMLSYQSIINHTSTNAPSLPLPSPIATTTATTTVAARIATSTASTTSSTSGGKAATSTKKTR